MRIASGTTDQYIYFVAVDATDFTTRETGLSSFTVYRSRDGAAAAAMTTPTINETDSTNMPGVYELLLDEDMTIGSGNDTEEMAFHITATGMAAVTRTIELYRPKITAGNTLDVTSDGEAGIDLNNINLPVGAIPALGIIDNGTAQSVTSTTIVLRAAASFANDELIGSTVVITGGSTGVGQSRLITDYVSSTDTATVDTWITTPTGTITYTVYPTPPASSNTDVLPAVNVTEVGGSAQDLPTATALATVDSNVDDLKLGTIYGAAATGTLSTTQATSDLTGYANDQLIGRVIIWTSGAADGEATDITDYASASGLLTFTALTTAPGNGDTFKIV